MKMPRKIKSFAWKACKNILPTINNLKKKNIDIQSGCCFYQSADEDVDHVFLKCPDIRDMWLQYLPLINTLPISLNFIDTVRKVVQLGNDNEVALFFMLCWCLW